MSQAQTDLQAQSRKPEGSRSARRLRRTGVVPGIVYGGEAEPATIQIEAAVLNQTLRDAGAVLNLKIDGGDAVPVIVKDQERHPVRGEITHIDLLRVNLNVAVQAVVSVELIGAEDAPGVKVGGVLEHLVREVTIEALPTEIPESLSFDVSHMEIGDSASLSELTTPEGVELVDDGSGTAIVTLSAPRIVVEEEEDVATETERIGEEGEESEGDGGESADGE